MVNLILRRNAKQILGPSAKLHVRASAVEQYGYPPAYKALKQWGHGLAGVVCYAPLKVWSSLYMAPGHWDQHTTPFASHRTYKEMADLHEHVANYQGSGFYQQAKHQIERLGYYRYKKQQITSIEALQRFFDEYLVHIFKSMQQHGYVASAAADHPGVMVGRDGRLIKSPRGRHRWAAASVLGIGGVVAEIDCIHPTWLKQINGGFEGAKLERLKASLSELEQRYQ